MKKKNKIVYRNFIQKNYLDNKLNKKFGKKYNKIIEKITENLDTTKNTFHSLSKNFKFNFKIKDLVKFKKFKTIVIIGMGGSILGSEAIYFFLKKKIKKDFLFFNNIDEQKLIDLKNKKKINEVLFVIISKSGNTIETILNSLFLKIIKKNIKNVIVISEKNNNPLYKLSKKFNLFHIEHKNYIGGRYSVLSEVGMLPAYLMGINIFKLRQNLLVHFKGQNKKFLKDSSIKLANILKKKKLRNLIFLNYIPELNKFLYWSQQLIAESLGKKEKGFLPLISSAPKDHHSLLQLYLDGPRDKLFYIFSYDDKAGKKLNFKSLNNSLNFLDKKTLNQIKLAQKDAFLKTISKKNIPYREFKIKSLNEQILSELFSYFILETAITGKLVGINPFDQPAVEAVKNNVKKLLI